MSYILYPEADKRSPSTFDHPSQDRDYTIAKLHKTLDLALLLAVARIKGHLPLGPDAFNKQIGCALM